MFACLLVPDFSVQSALLPEPENAREALRRSPLAILDGPSSLLKVSALNSAARRAGIALGMTKLQVETCGGVLLRKRAIANEDCAQAALLECANAFSPCVESTCPGTVILDLDGTEKLFGPLENIACKVMVSARRIGLYLRIAIAANPDAALYAARGFTGITVIPAGDEAKDLGRLPVNLLPAAPELLEVFERWGIRTFHSLACLPPMDLVERFGQEGLTLQKLAQGQINRPLRPIEPLPKFVESYEFEDPVETLESLAFILNRVLQDLCDRLISQSLATNELRLTLDLEVKYLGAERVGDQYQHNWKLPVPTQDRNMLFTLVRLDLERNTFVAPIRKLTIEAIPIKPRTAQRNLFAPPSPEAEQLEITLARIRGVVGDADAVGMSCVGSPRTVDSHQPGALTVQPFSTASGARNLSPSVVPTLALRMFRPALEASVELTGEKPHIVRLWKKHRRVIAASGPWCTSGNWWHSARAWAREEWDVALKTVEGIGYYRIYLDRLSQQWFVEGVFD